MKYYFTLCLCCFLALSVHAQDQPNFILIYVDDLNFAGNAVGGQNISTPHLQRVANAGVSFENAHVNGTICSPSRASMLTGVYPHTSGYYGYAMASNKWDLNPVLSSVTDIFQHFKNHGYDVYGAGKLFHGNSAVYADSFTHYDEAGSNGPWAWDGVSTEDGQPVLFAHPSMPADFSSHTDGVAPLSDVPTIEGYSGWINRDGTPFNYVDENDRDFLTDELVRNFGVDIIDSQSVEEPFFLALGITKPHSPFYLPEMYFDMHPLGEIALPNILTDDLADVPVGMMNNRWNSNGNWDGYRALTAASADSSDQQWWLKRYMQGYYAGVSFVDDLLGDILDALENSPHENNTYVIYVSDHGFHLGEKTLIKKTTLYDVVTKVPFLISGPDVQPDAVVQSPVSCIDLFPTMLDLANLPAPEHSLDGYSLKPLLEDPEAEAWGGPAVALCSTASNEDIPDGSVAEVRHQHHTVKSAEMRYSLYATGEQELYDHSIDSDEHFNLAKDPAYQDDLEWHRSELLSLLGIEEGFLLHDTSDFAFHGGFEQGLNGWRYNPGNAVATVVTNGEQTEGEAYLEIGGADGAQLINKNIKLVTGQDYTAFFDARCAQSTDVEMMIQRDGTPNFSILHLDSFAVSTEWQTYESPFEFTDDFHIFNNRIRFDIPPQATCDFDRVRIFKNDTVIASVRSDNIYPARIFPNPYSRGPLMYDLSEAFVASGALHVKIYSANGTLVHEQSLPPHSTDGSIDISGLPGGIYFVQFSDKAVFSTIKLVVR